jgi:UDP-2,4-diacetamido-2,4,6-trideoxy-beta-L-altropyranose hydrolase
MKPTPPRIAFRVDATPALGHGHLKRCLALALALRAQGAEIAFAGRWASGSAAGAASDILAAEDIPWSAVPLGDAGPEADAALCVANLPWTPDAVVVDHYGLDRRWHAEMRAATGARIVVIDDLADRPLAPDLLLDPNPAPDASGGHAAKYARVLPAGVPLCGGPGYALLDAAYADHARAAQRDRVETIGLFLGGTDPAHHTAWALRVLRQDVGWTGAVRIASTSANLHLASLRAAAASAGAVLLLDQPNLADFHASCDLQVGAGGGALWERCCLGVPTIALICADNQRLSVPHAAAEGAVVGLDAIGQTASQAAALAGALRDLIDSPQRRQGLHARALALVDGQGAPRAAAAVLELLRHPPPPTTLSLRPAALSDAGLLLAWRNDEQTRAASHHREPVPWEDHMDWLRRSLADPLRSLWIACRGNQPVGTVRADREGDAGPTTLSWTVAPDQRGSGVGRAMVQLAAQGLSGPLHAEVKAGNAASARIAEAAGLQAAERVGDTLHFRRNA